MTRKEIFESRRKNHKPAEITTHYLDEYVRNVNEHPMLREARAFKNLLLSTEPLIYPEELIVGVINSSEPVAFHYGSGTFINRLICDKYESSLGAEAKAEFNAKLEAVERNCYCVANPKVFNDDELRSIEACAATSTWFGGHMVLDFETILSKGLRHYFEAVAKKVQNDFYLAMTTMLEGIRGFILAYANKAQQLKTAEGYDYEKMSRLSENLQHISYEPPESFEQAIQLVWFIHMLNNCDSFGRFDYYLQPFYKNITKAEAHDLIYDFWLKIEEAEQIQNMTLGGVDSQGKDFYPELTELCIRVTEEVGYKGPNLCLRVTETMPEAIWNAANSCIGSGLGLPALYNDKVYIDSLTGFGYDTETARGYCLAGCSQIMIPGKCNFINDIGLLNAAKIAELTLNNGFDPRTGKQVGPMTGTTEQLDTFDKLMKAYYKQLAYFCKLEVEIHNKEAVYRHSCEGYVIRTMFMQDCIEAGKNIYDGGARYNNIELEIIGITNAADHFHAINEMVYKRQELTLTSLADILRNDFEGQPQVQARLKNFGKFGNDIQEVDNLRTEITSFIYDSFNKSKSIIGGIYVPGEVIFVAHEYCGKVTGATADGRNAWQVLADSAAASQGFDRNGPTALLSSVLRLPVKNHLLTSVVTNVRFLPDVFESKKVETLFKSFFKQGGSQLQVNVCDSKVLLEAQKNPELYSSLVVRVGGYSDYFVRLSKDLQDEIIQRTAY